MRYALWVTVLLCLITGGVFLSATLRPSSGNYIENSRVNITAATEYWKTKIRVMGPAAAEEYMVREVNEQEPKNRHELAHTFGTALYELDGTENARFCPEEFLYGCFHQVMGLAIAEHGLGIIEELQNQCTKREGKIRLCAHALGHALVSFYGYSESDISRALDKCANAVNSPEERASCSDGAFMEYNLREIVAEEGRSIREFRDDISFTPCNDIDPSFRLECIFQLPFWWRSAMTTDSDGATASEMYARMGALCRTVSDSTSMRYCFAGVGFAITWFENFNHEKILLYCRTAGTSPSQELTCVAKAAHNARVNKLPYQDLCEALDPVSSVYCKEFAQLFSEQALKLDPPTLNTSE